LILEFEPRSSCLQGCCFYHLLGRYFSYTCSPEFNFLVILGFELRASHLLGRPSTTHSMFLISISLMAKLLEHLLVCLLAIRNSFDNHFNSFVHLIGLFILLCLIFGALYILILIPCQMNSEQRFFSHSVGYDNCLI
jgi:hypothetical protein